MKTKPAYGVASLVLALAAGQAAAQDDQDVYEATLDGSQPITINFNATSDDNTFLTVECFGESQDGRRRTR